MCPTTKSHASVDVTLFSTVTAAVATAVIGCGAGGGVGGIGLSAAGAEVRSMDELGMTDGRHVIVGCMGSGPTGRVGGMEEEEASPS